MIGLGLIIKLDDADNYKIACLIIQFFHGLADIINEVTCYTILCNIYSDQLIKIILRIDIACSLGLALGPILGSFLSFEGQHD